MARGAQARHTEQVAKDVMQRKVLTVRPYMTVHEVANLFIDQHISGAPVVDRQQKLVGVISQTDLVRHDREASPSPVQMSDFYQEPSGRELLSRFQIEEPDYTRVQEIMTPAVFLANEETPVAEIGRFMLRKHIHRVIVTRDGALAGIVTTMDVLRSLLGSA